MGNSNGKERERGDVRKARRRTRIRNTHLVACSCVLQNRLRAVRATVSERATGPSRAIRQVGGAERARGGELRGRSMLVRRVIRHLASVRIRLRTSVYNARVEGNQWGG
jgi:hypothetical protein